MTKKEIVDALADAYIVKSFPEPKGDIMILNEQSPLYELVRDVQYKLNEHTGSFELDYSIMSDACTAMASYDADDIDNIDTYEIADGTASVYTATQLSWLNINNQSEIADVVREHETDIGTACAVWYEQQVATACDMLRDMINENAQ